MDGCIGVLEFWDVGRSLGGIFMVKGKGGGVRNECRIFSLLGRGFY